ncbi:unnamed protein product [Trichobilharzia szidati]|nr:unnamed protein product [Trichobilharzia szidati]
MKSLISMRFYYDLSIKNIWLYLLWIYSCLQFGVHCEIIEVVHPPTFIKTPQPEVYINPEEPLIIPCYAKAKPEPRYYWTLNGERVNWIKPYTSVLSRNLAHSSETTSPLPYEVTDPISHFNYSNIPYLPDESGLWYFGVQRLSNDLKPGVYQCVAVNSYGRALSVPMKLEIARKLMHLKFVDRFMPNLSGGVYFNCRLLFSYVSK